MKYGETLRQRSIPEWGHYNVDYDEIKHLIKEHTTPGEGKAVSIPGQVNTTEDEFERQLFDILAEQHQRIDLFVKCKSGEIERRLDHLQRQLARLQSREPPTPPSRIPARRLEQYGNIEGEVLKTGEEIRSLSRFIGAQRLAFSKLLKKYKKWTGSHLLELRFNQEVVNRSGSFSKVNMGPLLDHWTDVLCAVRAPFQKGGQAKNLAHRRVGSVVNGNTSVSMSPSLSHGSSAVATRIQTTVVLGSEAEFDMLMFNFPLGNAGQKAVYLVHQDQIVELQVLLLQYMRLFMSRSRSVPSACSAGCLSQDSSVNGRTIVSPADKAGDTGTLVLADPDSFLKKYSSSIVGEEDETAGSSPINAAGIATWTSNSEAVIAIDARTPLESVTPSPETTVKLKRKHLGAFLDMEQLFPMTRSSGRPVHDEKTLGLECTDVTAVEAVRSWFLKHENGMALVGICSKRTRFVGLGNNDSHGLWASLDQDIFMKKDLQTQLADDDWYAKGCHEAIRFPHAVLEIRQEGECSSDIIKVLDQSHLVRRHHEFEPSVTFAFVDHRQTERVRGFSLKTHAVWSCCQPLSIPPPYWLPVLNRDIRKIPEPTKLPLLSPSFGTPRPLSTSATSVTEGQTSSSSAACIEESPATSVPDQLQSSPLTGFRNKRKRVYKENPLSGSAAAPIQASTPRYWSEYDHPEDGSQDDAYVIYIDQASSSKFPGQAMATKVLRKIKRHFGPSRLDVDSPLLYSESSDGNDSMTSSDEATRMATSRNYGTIRSGRQALAASKRKTQTCMSRFFRSTRKPRSDLGRPHLSMTNAEALSSAVELHHQHSERSKLRLCVIGLAASIVVIILVSTLAATGRNKQRSTVDFGILFGIVTSILFTLTGTGYMLSRLDRVGMAQWALVIVVFVGVCVANGALLAWMLT